MARASFNIYMKLVTNFHTATHSQQMSLPLLKVRRPRRRRPSTVCLVLKEDEAVGLGNANGDSGLTRNTSDGFGSSETTVTLMEAITPSMRVID
jgi:hypothetical protein